MNNNDKKIQRQVRVRRKIRGTTEMPRLSVFRSNRHIAAQIIDDSVQKTIIGVSEKEGKGTKSERARALGKAIAEKALALKVGKVVFDKGSYRYHGRVKALADGAREGGLQF